MLPAMELYRPICITPFFFLAIYTRISCLMLCKHLFNKELILSKVLTLVSSSYEISSELLECSGYKRVCLPGTLDQARLFMQIVGFMLGSWALDYHLDFWRCWRVR